MITPPGARQPRDVLRRDRVCGRLHSVPKLAQALVELLSGADSGYLQWDEHRPHLLERHANQALGPGNQVVAILASCAGAHDAIEIRVRDTAGEALLTQIGCPRITVRCGLRVLQKREQILDPVVCRKRLAHQPRQQQLVLAKRLDDALLRHLPPLRVRCVTSCAATSTLARGADARIG